MPLTADVCSRIVAHIPSYKHKDLRSLLHTNRAFHVAALPKFYSRLIFTDIARTSKFTFTVNYVAPHLAVYIRTFGISLRSRGDRSAEDADFWEGVRNAMKQMKELENLILVRIPGPSFTSFLADTEWPFKLRQIELQLAVDAHILKFLNGQADAGCLRIVQLYPSGTPSLSDKDKEIVLPTLDLLDTSLSLAPYIQAPSLIYLQLIFDCSTPTTATDDTDITHILSKLPFPPLLRSLSIVDLPTSLSTRILAHLVSSSPTLTDNLLHLSHFYLPEPYPIHSPERASFFASLVKFRRLQSIEVSLDAWHVDLLPPLARATSDSPLISLSRGRGGNKTHIPTSNIDSGLNTQSHPSQAVQRVLITEMATYCPTLRTIVLWHRQTRVTWSFIEARDGLPVRAGGRGLHERDVEDAIAAAAADGGGGGGSRSCNTRGSISTKPKTGGVERVSPRIENSAKVGTWQYCGEAIEWPGNSNLWCSC